MKMNTLFQPYTRADAETVRHGLYIDLAIGRDFLSKNEIASLESRARWITDLLSDDANDDDLAEHPDAMMLIAMIEAEGSRRMLSEAITGTLEEASEVVSKVKGDDDT